MALPLYLAMTAGEFEDVPPPAFPAYMACHFSVYGRGLQDLPSRLPPGCMLILDDRIPLWNHDPKQVAEELGQTITDFRCSGLLLDFQRPGEPLMMDITRCVSDTLTCPVAVTEAYAEAGTCAVLIRCPNVNQPLENRCENWEGREKWLEVAPEVIRYTITKDSSHCEVLEDLHPEYRHQDERLCCSYRLEIQEDRAVFTLGRTWENLKQMMAQAEELGFTRAVGLYQQLGSMVVPGL